MLKKTGNFAVTYISNPIVTNHETTKNQTLQLPARKSNVGFGQQMETNYCFGY